MCKEKPEIAARAKVIEKRLRDGSVFSAVKVYEHAEGVMSFREVEQTGTEKTEVVDDGESELYAGQMDETFKHLAKEKMGDVFKKTDVGMKELGMTASGQAASSSSSPAKIAPRELIRRAFTIPIL